MNDSRGHLDAEHYRRVLELGPSFGHDKLKAAYRRLILMWHPDRHPSDAEVQTLATEKAKQLNTAYEYLSELLDENGGEYRSPEKYTGSATRPFRSATRRSWQSTSARPKHTYRGSIYKTGFPDPTVTEIFLKSSNIISTGYKRASRTLYIKFDGDVVYRYEGVPDGVFEDFLSAESHGRYAHRHIYPAYKYQRC